MGQYHLTTPIHFLMSRQRCMVVVLAALALAVVLCSGQAGKGPAQESFELDGVVWTVYKDEGAKRVFFYNTKTGASLWEDPRTAVKDSMLPTTALIAFLAPFTLLILGGGAYLLYLWLKSPQKLQKPKKVKKVVEVYDNRLQRRVKTSL